MLWNLFLQDLNLYLQDKVYLAGNQFTLADAFMYNGIHPLIVSHLFSHFCTFDPTIQIFLVLIIT